MVIAGKGAAVSGGFRAMLCRRVMTDRVLSSLLVVSSPWGATDLPAMSEAHKRNHLPVSSRCRSRAQAQSVKGVR